VPGYRSQCNSKNTLEVSQHKTSIEIGSLTSTPCQTSEPQERCPHRDFIVFCGEYLKSKVPFITCWQQRANAQQTYPKVAQTFLISPPNAPGTTLLQSHAHSVLQTESPLALVQLLAYTQIPPGILPWPLPRLAPCYPSSAVEPRTAT
jgi:hypothetical protein